MNRLLLIAIFGVWYTGLKAQVTYIGILDHNTGGGTSNNLFNYYISPGSNAFIDYEVWAIGLTSSDACGTKTQSRVVVRTTGNSDPRSVVASTPVYVNGICNGKNGNNDKYYVNLNSVVSTPGRYSVEIQADVAGSPNPYDQSTAATNWNYYCPPAWYLSGNAGPTGLYYDPAVLPCFSTAGKSDPIGGTNVDKMNTVSGTLNYFTVGEAAPYREMVVFGENYYDMTGARFQPGNPALPVSLNGVATIPQPGLCLSNQSLPALSMGAELNVFKRTDCSADITGARMYYRVYKSGITPPAYSFFDITWKDDCPGPSGPTNNVFPGGGSCNNINSVLDQRWQASNGVSNILPASLTTSDSGIWNIDFYTETYTRNCSGTPQTITGNLNTTTFTVLTQAQSVAQGCSGVLPLYRLSLSGITQGKRTILNWESNAVSGYSYYVERSTDGIRFNRVALLPYDRYQYADVMNTNISGNWYYRVVMLNEARSTVALSNIFSVSNTSRSSLFVYGYGPDQFRVEARQLKAGMYDYVLYAADGRAEKSGRLTLQSGTNLLTLQAPATATGCYFFVLRDAQGTIAGTARFLR